MNTHVRETIRREIVNTIEHWAARTTLPAKRLTQWCELPYQKFLRWRRRSKEPDTVTKKVIPKRHWLLPSEIQGIVTYAHEHPGHGYRRLAWMLTDDDVAYASPSSVYRILKRHDLLILQEPKPSRKGHGFKQPKKPHQHWHVDFSYFKIGSVYFYFIAILDGYSRAILAWDLREKMEERDAEIVIQAAKEAYPNAKPRIISDQGSQFRSNDFKRFVSEIEATHVMTSPYYPQSNGKLERFHQTLKDHAYKKLPLDLEDGKRIIGEMIDYYNHERLHSSIDYVTPHQCLAGQRDRIVMERKAKHHEAAKNRHAYWAKKDLASTEDHGGLTTLEEAEAERAEERSAEEYSSQATMRQRRIEPEAGSLWLSA
jgi:transposase InsO family protein